MNRRQFLQSVTIFVTYASLPSMVRRHVEAQPIARGFTIPIAIFEQGRIYQRPAISRAYLPVVNK